MPNRLIVCVLALLLLLLPLQVVPANAPIQGLRDNAPQLLALINAEVIPAPGQRWSAATVLIDGRRIIAAGPDVSIPDGAVVLDMSGRWIYPGFIDLYAEYGVPAAQPESASGPQPPQYSLERPGAVSWNAALHAEREWAAQFQPEADRAQTWLRNGFTVVQTARLDGILRGRSAVVSLADGTANERIIEPAGLHFGAFNKGVSTQAYPSSLMGSIALLRQTLSDVRWYAQARQASNQRLLDDQPGVQRGLMALQNVFSEGMVFDAGDADSLLRAQSLAAEFELPLILRASHDAWQHAQQLAGGVQALILDLDFPAPPPLANQGEQLAASLAELRRWERAPAQPGLFAEQRQRFALTQHGLEDASQFWQRLHRARAHGLGSDQALAALTTTPAELLGMDDRLGRIGEGYRANLVIADGDLFEGQSRLLAVYADGKRYTLVEEELLAFPGHYQLRINDELAKLLIRPESRGLSLQLEHDEQSVRFDDVSVAFDELRAVSSEAIADWPARQRIVLRPVDAGLELELLAVDGQRQRLLAERVVSEQEQPEDAIEDSPLLSRSVFPNHAFGLEQLPEEEHVLIRNATVWTMGEQGVLEQADVLFRDGRIRAVGEGLDAPGGAVIIDAEGMHLTPGLIDEHSHIAIARGVNEATHPVTSETRIGDVLNPHDVNIYRGLAGGTTTSQLLHGSANPIGGQGQVIKLRWGQDAEGLKMSEAPPTIKLALGENVKQSNWGDHVTSRYPQTRMGVDTLMRDALIAGAEYRERMAEWESSSRRARRDLAPPRVDYQLEALAEIMHEERFIHVHSYVASEVLAFLRLAESLDFRIQTFTHILDGYKVANEMAAHGTTASSFADWWAYKYEVVDAIPQNPCLLHAAGVLTSINSDSADLHRRLNQEAAKTLTYCDRMDEIETLAMVTINPARQLKIDQYVGSIEPGKHADLVLWNDHPLSVYARAEQTWIDGRQYFSRERDAEIREVAERERQALIEKVLAGGEAPRPESLVEDENEHEWHCDHSHDVWAILNRRGVR